MRKALVPFVIVLLLAAILCIGGCSENNNDTSSEQSTALHSDDSTYSPTDEEDDGNAPESDWMEDKALRILTIGNSFSDDTMQYIYQIAKSAGVNKISLGNLYIGGCSLNTHAANAKADKGAYEYRTNIIGTWSTANNFKMSDAIKSQKWDFISLQQSSGVSGIASSYAELEYLIGYVKALCPDAKLVWNMTWAYQQDSTHSSFPNYNSNQTTMYNAILDAVDKVIRKNDDISIISPTGTAIQNARTSYVGDKITRDGYHLSYDFGRYIAGLTFFSQLTGISAENVTFAPDGVDDSLQKVAIEAASNAVKAPAEVTVSQYKTEPLFDESKYTRLEISWNAFGYWYSTSSANHHNLVKTASNSNKFYATQMFTKDQLPVGSVIILADGWQYRPEAWKSEGVQASRPSLTSATKITVTESWWADYTHRAFNLSKKGSPVLTGVSQSEIDSAFVIWIPKK